MVNKWYWLYKYVLIGPFLRLYNRPTIENVERIPATGAAILASNHQSVADSFYLPLLCPRQITFLAKSEYFTQKGFAGTLKRKFFESLNQIPVNRTAKNAFDSLLEAAGSVLTKGRLLGIYPEGTRSPDGRVYRGKTGMARVALHYDVPVIPVAMLGAREANPPGTVMLRPVKVGIRIGEPIQARAFVAAQGLDPLSHEAARVLTDEVMRVLTELSEKPYVDIYAQTVKASLEAGKGYPEGA
ncbi:1-acyl-sn-glycerol-3-phosphate acyltransferase [Corynebacterium sp. HS2168-gen11]|uniref:lysophospholipid acyltransferase family protein n=1 Tax=Corynebacterium sp. HS2168-gen11 TaxID=2974027 RepID=UPI00216B2E94|nr:lysophospholipid acyltransferase family protein [Corynebacterium sp. HS2168-gen11]MCS4536173.1 1-acyl-sn-glycerol-3-phosphate acyltransferase [Corynebacterium sp. HS2168-gen11]